MAPRALDLKDPIQSQLIDHGLIVADFDGMSVFQEGVAAGGLVSKVPVVGHIEAKYRDYLFKDYIPRLKMEMATEAAKRNFQRYKKQVQSEKITRDQLFELTANQANAAFGELNYKMLGRNPLVQDLLRLSTLAPDFLEARMRFTGQALKPYGREQATALLLRGAVGMYVSARIINQVLDDDPHWDRPFSVVIKGREYALRTVPGDIYHLVSDPRSFVYHRLNPTFTRPAVEALFGRDQLGRPRSAWDQVKDFVAGVAPIPVQGSFDTGKSKLDAFLQAGGVSSTKHRSAAERLARKYRLESGFGLSNKSEAEPSLLRKYRRTIDDGTFDIRDVANDVKGHKLTIDDARELERDSKQPALVRDFKSLTLDRALDVWDEMTPEEKKLSHDALETKAVNQLKTGKMLPEARRRMVVRIKQALRPEAPTTGLGQPLVPILRHLMGSQQAAP
jgi:hypothetical protein